jgi:hypothetical protein
LGRRPAAAEAARVRSAREALLLPVAFAAAVGLAELLGAANLGVAFAFGQIAFAATVMWLILRS